MTVNETKALCIKAHEGQFRRKRLVTEVELEKNWDEIKQLRFSESPKAILIAKNGNVYSKHTNGDYLVKEPYHIHPIAIADMMGTDEEKIVAYLHDVCEDCAGYGLGFGKVENFSSFWIITPGIHNDRKVSITYDIYCALSLLVHEKDRSYNKYIKDITQRQFVPNVINYKPNKLALKVKIADMFHNMSCSSSEKQKAKYLQALPILLKAL